MLNAWKTRWLLIGGAAALAQVIVMATVHRGSLLAAWADLSQLVVVAVILAGFLRNSFRSQGNVRIFWLWMSVGAALWTTSQSCWVWYEVVLQTAVPSPFPPDIVLFLHVVPMMAAIAVQPHRKKELNGISPGTLDFALLLLWWIFLYVFMVIPWQYLKLDVEVYGTAFNVLYLVEHVAFLVGLGYIYTRASGKWRELYRQLLIGGLVYAISSLALNIAIDLPSQSPFYYYSGSIYDLPLLLALIYWAYVAFLPTQLGELEPEEAASAPSTSTIWSARVAMMAVLSLPLLALCVLVFPNAEPVHTFRLVVTCIAMAVLSALLFMKQRLMETRLFGSLEASRRAYDDLRNLQTHLLQTEKLASIGRLVAGAAHEINNPLTAILGYSDLLAGHEDIQEQHREMADKIRQQARRTKTLVSNLLNFAKQSPAERSSVDLNDIIGRALKLRELDLLHKNIQVVTDLEPNISMVKGDENHLLQVCFNIFHNAVDAMQEAHGQGTLTIGTTMVNGRVALHCADTGTGVLDPDRIFDPFYTTKAVGKGSGLGLSACYGIIRDHGGEITCENLSGGGALFTIYLPAMKPELAPNLSIPAGA